MRSEPLDIAIVGLSITSSWGNGHATTFRGLVRELAAQGHLVTFYERDVPWYREHRDLADAEYCRIVLYDSIDELSETHGVHLRFADAVIVGSYVPQGIEVIDRLASLVEGVFGFYDIDTPVTLDALSRRDCEYLSSRQVPLFDLYLSFTGGPTLQYIERELRAPMARPLYCSFDAASYHPLDLPKEWELGYLGTWSEDRQPGVEMLLNETARSLREKRFVVAGPMYPPEIEWPPNVDRVEHVPPSEHARFYARQRFTLNVTRREMKRLGWSPSVRLFEAAACGVPIISDRWEGIETLLEPGREILLCDSSADVLGFLQSTDEDARREIGRRARERVLSRHTAAHRAAELEAHIREAEELRMRSHMRVALSSEAGEARAQS